jgi:DNA-binding MarR family transcriptional regulator
VVAAGSEAVEHEHDEFTESLLAALATVGRQVRRLAQRPAEFELLTGAQLELIRLLRRRPGLSVAEAAAELHLAPNTVSTLVRQLGDAGMVRRQIHESDRRIACLELSTHTEHTFDAFRDRRLVTLGKGVAGLSADDRRRLADALPALDRLAEVLRRTTPRRRGTRR